MAAGPATMPPRQPPVLHESARFSLRATPDAASNRLIRSDRKRIPTPALFLPAVRQRVRERHQGLETSTDCFLRGGVRRTHLTGGVMLTRGAQRTSAGQNGTDRLCPAPSLRGGCTCGNGGSGLGNVALAKAAIAPICRESRCVTQICVVVLHILCIYMTHFMHMESARSQVDGLGPVGSRSNRLRPAARQEDSGGPNVA